MKYLTWPGHQGTRWGDYYSPEWKWQTYTTATITLWQVPLAFLWQFVHCINTVHSHNSPHMQSSSNRKWKTVVK